MSMEDFESVSENWNGCVDDFDEFARIVEEGVEFYDPDEKIVYIADMGGNNGGEVFGYMVAELGDDAREAEEGEEDIASWALGSIPAPGSGTPDRMEQISIEEMFEELQARFDTMLFRKVEP